MTLRSSRAHACVAEGGDRRNDVVCAYGLAVTLVEPAGEREESPEQTRLETACVVKIE